ncbi:hypothetical protein [Pedobacter metabolipauper]|uniref:Uncharacterized protein n=1 Tax=Pedobacter metabolipauper TaxID=425513 RepID=A0A4R6T253_9SPHI|nr:hypothetical protein [Pedobacter metabolipauper]TDQ12179.1 hypothetical protein ATK78_1313 [Pedobacter metabolipauper]
MKATELRIGNFVQSIISNFELTVVGFIGDRIFYGNPKTPDVRPDYEIEPIPLTEDWLIKLGFTKPEVPTGYQEENDLYQTFIGRVTFGARLFPDNTYIFEIELNVGCGYTDVIHSPDYVHELQNLVYALTGEELTIKEPAV